MHKQGWRCFACAPGTLREPRRPPQCAPPLCPDGSRGRRRVAPDHSKPCVDIDAEWVSVARFVNPQA